MKKIKIVLDNNSLDKFIECPSEVQEIIINNCELIICDTLTRECEDIKTSDDKKYNKIILFLKKIKKIDCFMFAFKRKNSMNVENIHGFLTKKDIGNSNKSIRMLNDKSYNVYKNIHPNATSKKAESDRQIALIASLHNADILITEDGRFYNHLRKNNIRVMTVDEFIKHLKPDS